MLKNKVPNRNTQAYTAHNPDDLIIRDRLALDRTILANERTILGYIRTSLVMFGGGMSLIKLFPDDPSIVMIGWLFLPVAALCFTFGLMRFVKVRSSLKALDA